MPSIAWFLERRIQRRKVEGVLEWLRRADTILSRTDLRFADNLTTLLLSDVQELVREAIEEAEGICAP